MQYIGPQIIKIHQNNYLTTLLFHVNFKYISFLKIDGFQPLPFLFFLTNNYGFFLLLPNIRGSGGTVMNQSL